MMKLARTTLLLAFACLWALLAAFWWRSYRVMDEWSTVDEGNTLRAAVSFKGAVHFIRSGNNSTPRRLTWDTIDVRPDARREDLHQGRGVVWERVGFARISSAAPPPPPGMIVFTSKPPQGTGAGTRVVIPTPLPPASWTAAVAPWLLTWPYDAWVVPYWAPLVLVSIPLARFAFVILRRSYRRRRRRCAYCNYDLRESPERCPECGAAGPNSPLRRAADPS